MNAHRRARIVPAVIAVAALIAVTCGDDRPPGAGRSIIATTTVLAALAHRVTGEQVSTRGLIPAGTDPHAFAPSASQREQLLKADLLIVNGADLEEGLLDVIGEAAREGVPVLVAMEAVEPRRYPDGELDPHFWHDPQQAAAVAVSIGERLAALDPDNSAAYHDRAARFDTDLARLSEELTRTFSPLVGPQRQLVTNHDAYRYLAARFDFEVLGTIVPGRSTDATPSPTHLAELAALMRGRQVCAVFAEEEGSPALAESLAREAGPGVGVATLFGGTLPDGYEDLLRENARRIVDALSRCG